MGISASVGLMWSQGSINSFIIMNNILKIFILFIVVNKIILFLRNKNNVEWN